MVAVPYCLSVVDFPITSKNIKIKFQDFFGFFQIPKLQQAAGGSILISYVSQMIVMAG